MTSVAIIGAGLAGLTTAYWLRRHGVSVTVVDKRDGPGEGTSFANGGMLTPSQANPWNSPDTCANVLGWIGRTDSPLAIRPSALPGLASWGTRFLFESLPHRYRRNTASNLALGSYSLNMHKALVAETGLQFDRASVGTLQIFRSQASLDGGIRVAEFLCERGIEVRPLDAAATVELAPALRESRLQLAGGIHFPQDESGNALLFCCALAGHLQAHGVRFVYGADVTAIAVERGAVRAFVSPRDRIEADAFVVAAGPGAKSLLKRCGIQVPIYPVKGYSLTCDIAGLSSVPAIPIVDMGRKIALTPLGDRLRIAGTAEFSGCDTNLDERRLGSILRNACEIMPALREIPAAGFSRWAGLRPVTPTGFPILGRTRLGNLFTNAGHGPLGWTFAAGTGKIVADIIATGTHDLATVTAVGGRIA
jgi:D-amino-acid dehydrogenase